MESVQQSTNKLKLNQCSSVNKMNQVRDQSNGSRLSQKHMSDAISLVYKNNLKTLSLAHMKTRKGPKTVG